MSQNICINHRKSNIIRITEITQLQVEKKGIQVSLRLTIVKHYRSFMEKGLSRPVCADERQNNSTAARNY